MDYHQMTAPCGRDCFNCPLHLAKTNEEIRSRFVEKYHMKAEDVPCDGCRSIEGKCKLFSVLGFNVPCTTWSCAADKGHDYCFECADFPCDQLHPLADKAGTFPHNLKVFNLCKIQKMGVEAWGKNEAKRSFDKYYRDPLEL